METEKFELMLDEAQANAALEKGMLYADTFVNKNYLINLDRYPLVELDSAEKSDEYIRLYQIERIVYDVDENANDKLISVYSACFCTYPVITIRLRMRSLLLVDLLLVKLALSTWLSTR